MSREQRKAAIQNPKSKIQNHAAVYLACVRTCLARELAFRGHFLLLALAGVTWTLLSLALMAFLFGRVTAVAGWNLDRMIVLTGTYVLVVSLTNLLFARNMQHLSEYINKGELDLILVKPVNSQFFVSTRFLSLHELPSALAALVYVGVGLQRLGLQPGPLQVLGYAAAVASAIVSLYALWFMTVTLVLWTGRIENIAYALEPVMDVARVPADVFRGLLRVLFTFVLPVAMISTVPSKALLGLLEPWMGIYAALLALALLWASTHLWRVGLRRYSSASS
ncbi:MAG: ABC-2 family transporter protein [Chloroflexi bacterium]|nr:ABC-2 family transporter protein [Chloroflexota bacterium]